MVRRCMGRAVLLFGLLTAGWTAPALAQAPTPNSSYQGCQAFVSDVTVEPGQVVTISGSGANPGDTVTARMDPTVASGTADRNGNFSFPATISAAQPSGGSTLTVTCGRNGGSAQIIVAVGPAQAPPTTAPGTATTGSGTPTTGQPPTTGQQGPGSGTQQPGSGNLPRTGTNSTIPLTRIGVALVAAGGLLLAVSRRRRWAHQTSTSN